jgi:hypothetical protein
MKFNVLPIHRSYRQTSLVAVMLIAMISGCSKESDAQTITVYKSPTCGCCKNWIAHLEDNGFKVIAHDTRNMDSVKREQGVPASMASCHTALVDGYIIEGHVPAAAIKRLLKEKPAVAGLAVPGMPMGSPGMEGPRKDRYNALMFNRSGDAAIYESY